MKAYKEWKEQKWKNKGIVVDLKGVRIESIYKVYKKEYAWKKGKIIFNAIFHYA